MPIRLLGRVPASHVAALAILCSPGAAAAAQERSSPVPPDAGTTSMAAPRGSGEVRWLVRIPEPLARRATLTALNAAVARFEDAGCRTLLLDFRDREGRPLQERLTTLQVAFDQYVGMLMFYDGSRSIPCDKGALAFTAPGSRVVHVCIDQLKRTLADHPEYAIATLIHEILHTLGLGENPPSSGEITRRVLARCGRR